MERERFFRLDHMEKNRIAKLADRLLIALIASGHQGDERAQARQAYKAAEAMYDEHFERMGK